MFESGYFPRTLLLQKDFSLVAEHNPYYLIYHIFHYSGRLGLFHIHIQFDALSIAHNTPPIAPPPSHEQFHPLPEWGSKAQHSVHKTPSAAGLYNRMHNSYDYKGSN